MEWSFFVKPWVSSPKDALSQVWLKLALHLLRRRFLNVINVFSLVHNYLPFIWTNLKSFSPKNALCQVFFLKLAKRFWRRIFLNVLNVFSLFLNYLPLERVWPFIWTNLNSLHPRMFCSKYGLNWPSGSGADIHSYVVIKGRPTPNIMLGYPLPKYLHIIVGSYERPGKTGYKHIYFYATL